MATIGRAQDKREAALLSVFGPAQVGDPLAPDREVADADRERDLALRTEFVRVAGADGRSYLVERPVSG
ncbi:MULTISPECIES: hypothetical protein [unclassified Cellulomonas]|uniref:hypothetical protein n=1 Tax=unclassified Cellulomonas TaxID=2620175 RepID=UPI00199C8DCD|nr:hypothetical protein [Cellulomonas sp. ES6]MBD3777853.1 hypothetical protein [Micrococcales bacterium]WHP18590.1 hypothetical protein P9841_05455 [Cellulomonas sp. ES6]